MKKEKSYKNIFELDYKEKDLVKYVCVLTSKVPVNDSKETKTRFVSKEELKELIKDLKQKGRLLELKEILENLKRNYWKEFENDLYRIVPIPMRFQYPYWIKLVEVALKNKSSVSAVIRRILLEKIEDIIRYIENSGDYNPEVISLLRRRLEDTKKGIKERRSLDSFVLFEEFLPEKELKEDAESDPSKARTANEIIEKIRSFVKLALKKKILASGVSEKLFELLLEYMVFEVEFQDASLRFENDELIIHIKALPPFFPRGFSPKHLEEVGYDEFIVDFPLAALQNHSPEEIKKLAGITGIPAFKGLSEEEINALKDVIVQSEKTQKISGLLDVSSDDVTLHVLREVYKNVEGFDPVFDSALDPNFVIPEIIQDWVKFAGIELLSIKIPITVKDDGVYVKGTNVKVDDTIALWDQITKEYKSRFDLGESSTAIDFENLSDESIDKLLDGVENELAVKGVEAISLLLSTKIAEAIRISEVFTTTLPYGLFSLLRLFTGKSPKEVIVDYLRDEL